jgi:hypothetical protein
MRSAYSAKRDIRVTHANVRVKNETFVCVKKVCSCDSIFICVHHKQDPTLLDCIQCACFFVAVVNQRLHSLHALQDGNLLHFTCAVS